MSGSATLRELPIRQIVDGTGKAWWISEVRIEKDGMTSPVFAVATNEHRAQALARRRARDRAQWL